MLTEAIKDKQTNQKLFSMNAMSCMHILNIKKIYYFSFLNKNNKKKSFVNYDVASNIC